MSAEAIISLISVTVTVVVAIIGGAVKICSKLEQLNLMICNMVTREQCAVLRKKCRWYRRKKS